ncbi:MAG: protein kinase [Acidobacteriota bacterium]|nr:MAG: protein kinase [Acidobacteriota bacterium]
MSISDESAPTSIRDQDHTPTKLRETKAQGGIHTTSSDGARFVAGHVLAGRYRIIGLIGRGGMGEVYKAEDLKLEQTVALKFLPEDLSRDEEALKRFVGEVRSARQVSHPNVCRVFDIGDTDGLYYISMEFIEGDDLSMLLGRIGRLPSDKAVEVPRTSVWAARKRGTPCPHAPRLEQPSGLPRYRELQFAPRERAESHGRSGRMRPATS